MPGQGIKIAYHKVYGPKSRREHAEDHNSLRGLLELLSKKDTMNILFDSFYCVKGKNKIITLGKKAFLESLDLIKEMGMVSLAYFDAIREGMERKQ